MKGPGNAGTKGSDRLTSGGNMDCPKLVLAPIWVGLLALLTLGCASTRQSEASNPASYTVEGRTAQSEADVISCATAQMQPRMIGASGPLTDRNGVQLRRDPVPEPTPYGLGTVSNSVHFRTRRSGDSTVLTVFAESRSFPTSGRGSYHSNNSVAIPATHEAKAKADALLTACAGED
jgi:hypothetical protein